MVASTKLGTKTMLKTATNAMTTQKMATF